MIYIRKSVAEIIQIKILNYLQYLSMKTNLNVLHQKILI